MASTALKLEAFMPVRLQPVAEPTFTSDDLEQARAEGLAKGREQGRNEDILQLCAGLERLSQSLAEDQNLRHEIRAEITNGFILVMSGIVDALAPLQASQRIEKTLTVELMRLVNDDHPISARIACNHKLRELVERSIAEAGITGIALDDTESDRISLSFAGGHTEFSNEKVVGEIRTLIEEIAEETTAWTT